MNPPPLLTQYASRPLHENRLQGGLHTRREFDKVSRPGRPLISVVTVVLNRKETVERAIGSVLNQTYDNIEYVIVDGGSTDGTLDLIRKYDNQIAHWISEPDSGIFDAMNKGIALCSGAYISLLNSDDFYARDGIERIANELNRGACDVAYGDFIFVVGDLGMEKRIPATLNMRAGMSIGHAIFISRGIYERLGLYSTHYKFAADLEFVLRIWKANVRFAKAEGSPVQYFTSGGAAESHLVAAIFEATSILFGHVGVPSAIWYGLKGIKRVVLRGLMAAAGAVCGRGAYIYIKKKYYQSCGFTPVTQRIE